MPTCSKLFNMYGPRWRCNRFCSKLEFWAEILFGHSLHKKNCFYGSVSPFYLKKEFKIAKKHSKKFYEWPEKGWKWTWIWIVSSRNGLNYIWMPKNSRILLKPRFFASNTLHSFCNLAVILINFLAKNGFKNP